MRKTIFFTFLTLLLATLNSCIQSNKRFRPRTRVSLGFNKADTSIISIGNPDELKYSAYSVHKNRRISQYRMDGYNEVIINEFIIPEKIDFTKSFTLLDTKKPKQKATSLYNITPFFYGDFLLDWSDEHQIKNQYIHHDSKLEVLLRTNDSLRISGTPSFLNFSNKTQDSYFNIGYDFKMNLDKVSGKLHQDILLYTTDSSLVIVMLHGPGNMKLEEVIKTNW